MVFRLSILMLMTIQVLQQVVCSVITELKTTKTTFMLTVQLHLIHLIVREPLSEQVKTIHIC